MNDIPGHQQYDARRSAGNTNDLRGKIMRIKINPDGSYSIPEGNLFPKGMDKTRPEIYVMGNRNPYRISVDQKNSFLYWGEVGPDASNDSFDTRGPRGYDEVNQARKAGYFGWPLFVGNNYPYRQFDYATGKSGPLFDPAKPINDSRNNTGLRELPPAQPAFIWYPYSASHDFPQVGTGGRNAMAGPVYYTDMFPAETRLPDYYNGKLFIYDWIRGWMKIVTMLPNGDFDKMEPFFPSIKVNSLIDMEVGPDGRLYLLEYGTGWFTKNADAGISRIDYNGGNRAPKITGISIDKTTGVLPFTVHASVTAKDPEKDKVTYVWNLGDGKTKVTTEPALSYTYNTPGDYTISVVAKDDKGDSSTSDKLSVYAGNETPDLSIDITSNKSFYTKGSPVKYAVKVTDPHDTATFDPANLFVSVEYVEGFDKAASNMGHHQGTAAISGKSLVQTLDCKGCHKEVEKSVGPAFLDISKKYMENKDAFGYLSDKIAKGGSGVWGEVAMPAHPNLAQDDLRQIVSWVLSLNKSGTVPKSLPATGSIIPPATVKPNAVLVLSASYTDKGGNNIKALTGTGTASLFNSSMSFTGKEKKEGFSTININGRTIMTFPSEDGWLATPAVDLTGFSTIILSCGARKPFTNPVEFEARLDSPNGKLLGKGSLAIPVENGSGTVKFLMEKITDGKMHPVYFVYHSKEKIEGGVTGVEFK
jgi:cytochrome c551/c552